MHEARTRSVRNRATFVGSSFVALIVIAAALAATASGHTAGKTISVAIVANPQMEDIATLTPSLFTKQTGINVNYTMLDEGTLREVTTRDVGAGGQAVRRRDDRHVRGAAVRRQRAASSTSRRRPRPTSRLQLDDLIPSVRGGALRRRHALRVAVLRRVVVPDVPQGRARRRPASTMPAQPDVGRRSPTIARKINTDDMAGICLRGKPGWGDLGASFTTVLNTFGGTWWSANDDGSIGEAQVDQPEFKEALRVLRRPRAATPARTTPPTPPSTSAWPSTTTARWRCGTTPPSPPACSRPTTAR